MKIRIRSGAIAGIAALLLVTGGPGTLTAQEDVIDIRHPDVFGKLRRPPVSFPHDRHMEALAEQGCGVCHHAWDPAARKLVYAEGEEQTCKECHAGKKKENMPALREAYHGSCTPCHREMKATSASGTGPTTCGECHNLRRAKQAD